MSNKWIRIKSDIITGQLILCSRFVGILEPHSGAFRGWSIYYSAYVTETFCNNYCISNTLLNTNISHAWQPPCWLRPHSFLPHTPIVDNNSGSFTHVSVSWRLNQLFLTLTDNYVNVRFPIIMYSFPYTYSNKKKNDSQRRLSGTPSWNGENVETGIHVCLILTYWSSLCKRSVERSAGYTKVTAKHTTPTHRGSSPFVCVY